MGRPASVIRLSVASSTSICIPAYLPPTESSLHATPQAPHQLQWGSARRGVTRHTAQLFSARKLGPTPSLHVMRLQATLHPTILTTAPRPHSAIPGRRPHPAISAAAAAGDSSGAQTGAPAVLDVHGLHTKTSNFQWAYEGTPISIHVEEHITKAAADNPRHEFSWTYEDVLLLPALSDVSTTDEWTTVAGRLVEGGKRRVLSVDWPGFGRSSRQQLPYSPSLLIRFLVDLLTVEDGPFGGAAKGRPVVVVGAGHAGTLVAAAVRSGAVDVKRLKALVMVAPTWAGPLPIVFGKTPEREEKYKWYRDIISAPFIGSVIYNTFLTSPGALRGQYKSHVYSNPDRITEDLLAARSDICKQEGARYAPAAFVTGALDPATSREDFIATVGSLEGHVPVAVVKPTGSPRRSKAEMEALQGARGITSFVEVPGALLAHEEYPEEVAQAVLGFLRTIE